VLFKVILDIQKFKLCPSAFQPWILPFRFL